VLGIDLGLFRIREVPVTPDLYGLDFSDLQNSHYFVVLMN
jgi:hypothetical protein